MRTTTANYDTANNDSSKHPVTLVQFAGVARQYSSGDFSGRNTTNVKKYLTNFRANLNEIDLLEGTRSGGQVSFDITDKAGDATGILESDPLVENTITVKSGFESIAEADFLTLASTYKITQNPKYSPYSKWSFTAKDPKRLIKGKIGVDIPRSSIETNTVTSSLNLTDISINDSTQFGDPTAISATSHLPIRDRMYVKIEDEFLSYKAKATGAPDTLTDGGGSAWIGRMQAGTDPDPANLPEAPTHKIGAAVSQAYVFEGQYPTEALLHVLLTGGGHAFYDLSLDEASFAPIGLGLTAAEVDIEGIERKGYLFNLNYEACRCVVIHEEVDANKWITDNLLKPAGLFMYINGAGKITVDSLDRLVIYENFTAVQALTKTEIKVNGWQIDYKNLLNNFKVKFNINPITDESVNTSSGKLDNSETQYGLNEKVFNFDNPLMGHFRLKGFNEQQTMNLLKLKTAARYVAMRRLLYTFGNPVGRVNYDTTPSNWLVEPADKVTITHDKMPETLDGTLGWTAKKFFVTKQSLQAHPYRNTYEAITLDAYDLVTGFYSFVTILEIAIDKTAVTFNSDNSVTDNAEDGRHVLGADISMDVVKITIGITPPASGTTEHYISMGINLYGAGGGSLTHSEIFRGIRYNSGDSTAFDVDLYVFNFDGGTPFIVSKVKVDWYDASATAVSGERPTVTFKELAYSTYGETISAV